MDGFKKKCLIDGLDDIGLSMEKLNQIDSYEKKINVNKPWILKNDYRVLVEVSLPMGEYQ